MKKITLILSMLLLVTISWQSYAQPANDDCAGAIGLTVNPDDLCGTITSATTNLATASPEADDVTGTPNTDVWFTFVATAIEQTIVISNVVNLGGGTSTSTDMGMGVYDGTAGCGALVFTADSDPNTLNLTGLTIGTTYYVRVYGWFSSVQYNDFDICVGVTPPPPPPPANDTLAGAMPIVPSPAGTGCTTFTFMDSVGGDGTTDSGLDGSCDGTFTGLDRFYSWTATSDALIWNDGAGNPGIVIRDAAGVEITCEGTFAAADVQLSGWAVGDALIIQIYDFNTADVDTSFCLEEFTLPLCPDPSAMVGNVGQTTNDLVWTAGATEDMWEIVYGIAPYVVPVDPTTDPSYMHIGPGATPDAMLTGLTGMSDYNLFYRAHCGGTDYSNWVQFDFTTLGPPPANDNVCNAIAIVVNDPAIVGNNTDSTMEVGEPNGSCWFGTGGSFNSVWYTFDATASFATVSTDFNTTLNDTHITIYEMIDCADMATLTELGCDEDGGSIGSGWNSIATLSGLTIGNTYYVQVEGYNSSIGEFNIEVTTTPANDLCADAIALTVGISSMDNVVSGTNEFATDSGEIVASCALYAGGDVWYSAVVPANGNIIVQTSSATGGDGGLAVYSGACGALTELACNDDGGPGLYSLIELTGLTPGDALLIRVWEYGNNAVINFDVVAYSPNCPNLTNLVANNFTAPDVADISWDAVVASGYNYEIQPLGVAQGTAGAIAMGSTMDPVVTATVTGLVDGTDYTLYVQSDCAAVGLGNWFSLDFLFALPPANDTFAGAIPIVPSPEGTGCAGGPTFTLPFSTDGTTDSGMDGSCNAQGLDQFFSWTATTNALTFDSQTPGSPGIVVYDATGVEVACLDTFTSPGTVTGWNVGDDLVIQIFDFNGSFSDVAFCLEELNITVNVPDCPTMTFPADGATEVSYPLVLTWNAALTGDPADSYNVYVSINGGAEALIGNYTATETQSINLLNPDLSIIWRVVPVNAAGENIACTTTFTFTTFVGTDDTDGDGIDNLTERDATPQSDMNDPCDPAQAIGYTGYDATNAIWGAADCDGDGQTNAQEFAGGSDPYDPNSTSSVEDLEAVGFNYYPNPVSKDLHLTARENITNVSIYNMIGQEVKRLTPSSLETTIDMSNLANGTYFVKAQVGNAVGTFKIVKK